VVLLGQDLQPLNPLVADMRPNLQIHQHALYTPVLRHGPGLRPAPGLAERWDTVRVAPDTLQLTFHLRHDVRWHDGTATTADDVVFTYQRLLDPRTASPLAAQFDGYAPGAERPDSFTARFRVRASPNFLVPWIGLPAVPRHLLAEVGPEAMRTHSFGAGPVGNGPFRFVRRVPGREWVFEANADHPAALGGRPRLDRLVFRIVPDGTARLTEVLTGRAHLSSLPYAGVKRVRAGRGARVMSYSDGTWNYVSWNLRDPLFRDARVRRALTMALDRAAMVQAVTHGYGQAGRTTVTPVHWAYEPHEPGLSLPHDRAGARRLLAEAGWRDRDGDGVVEDAAGRPFRFVLHLPAGTDEYRDAAVMAQSDLRRVGVHAALRQVEMNSLVTLLEGRLDHRGRRVRQFQAALFGWVDGPMSKDDSPYLHSRAIDGPYGQAGYSNPRADRLMDTLRLIMGREEARPVWREHQRLFLEDSPFTVLFYPEVLLVASDRLQGVEVDARGSLTSVSRWWLASAR
jgi:peptide/nickel transport system substrate-binding protein